MRETGATPKVYTVSEFVSYIRDFLRENVGFVLIQGEASGLHITQDRFVWFELKDKDTSVSCFMMKWELKVPLEDGMEIKVLGLPQLFQKSGRFHIRVEEIELVGAGALQKAFEALKKKLEKEGLFAEARKRALPRFPEAIGLITSPDAAAYTDVLRILKNRWAGLTIKFYPVAVQGIGSVKEIVRAFDYFNYSKNVEVIILTRGGGSLEDLQSFNSEDVARAIFSSAIPVVCGVGHERDESLSDYVADLRASTPSNAAELVVPDKREIMENIVNLARSTHDIITSETGKYKDDIHEMAERMSGRVTERVLHGETLVTSLINRAVGRIEHRIEAGKTLIAGRITRLIGSFERALAIFGERITSSVRLLKNLNPQALLERGYALIWNDKNELIKSVHYVKIDETVKAELADGAFFSKITRKLKRV